MVPIGVLASGRGSNLDAILDAVDNHYLTKCEVKIFISNRPNAPALDIARKHRVQTITLDDKGVPKKSWDYDQKTIAALESRGVAPKNGLIVLAGYLRILTESIRLLTEDQLKFEGRRVLFKN